MLWIAALPLLAQAGGSPSSGDSSPGVTKPDHPSAAHQSDGERKFTQNCGRCHMPPESFSPHISGTIVLHMRVRASLSKKDEEDILRFLNP
jgi:mono/diheme cytochrome c family protein